MSQRQRLLVANRGEIAVRVFSTARELGLHTIAVYTDNDRSHITHAHEAVQVASAASFVDVKALVQICTKHKVDLVHPGYGFLSESSEFAEALQAAGTTLVGPSSEILRQTGNKLSARRLAETCKVPVLPALTTPTEKLKDVADFAQRIGYPIMLKAIDGGGGRGIRLVNNEKELDSAFQRAVSESLSRNVFAEKAAVDGFRHVEVQILGDGRMTRHFWERECSIQRKFQKVVEIAPSTLQNRKLVAAVIESALRMAQSILYAGLGTWEFLVSPSTSAFYFMEINPRLQVEHSITETMCGVDLVKYQLLVAQGKTFQDLSLPMPSPAEPPPKPVAIQLRLTAEDPKHNFMLSIGRIKGFTLPGGNGIRVDTHLRPDTAVSPDFDSLLGKLIVSSNDWDSVVSKCLRALADTSVDGITTNIDLLRGIVLSEEFRSGNCNTQWLEREVKHLLDVGTKDMTRPVQDNSAFRSTKAEPISTSTTSLKKGEAFNIRLNVPGFDEPFEETLAISKVLKNDFPTSLAIDLTSTKKSAASAGQRETYSLQIEQSTGLATTSSGRKGDPNNPAHLICPLAGQVVEILVEDGDVVDEWEPVAIVRQMKMEVEIRAQRGGVVRSLWDIDEGDDVGSGALVCEIIPEDRLKEKL